MIPSGHTAVMASRREPPDSLEFFPTPPWATRALCEHVFPHLGLAADLKFCACWDPACGEGHMFEVLLEYFAGGWGTRFGTGNGSTTFNIPDANGTAIYGRDNGKGRLTGAGGLGGNVGDRGGSETVGLSEAQMPAHSHAGGTSNAGAHDHGGTNPAGQHSHGGSTGGAGGHNHNGTTGGAGSHSHGGNTSLSGNHAHDLAYTKLAIYGGGGGLTAVSEMYPPSVGNSTAVVGGAGEHQHTIATDSVGDHTHNFTTSGVSDHAHTINADGNHTHSIPAVGDHNHSLNIASTGGGQAHPNMPPGLVGVIAIKG